MSEKKWCFNTIEGHATLRIQKSGEETDVFIIVSGRVKDGGGSGRRERGRHEGEKRGRPRPQTAWPLRKKGKEPEGEHPHGFDWKRQVLLGGV